MKRPRFGSRSRVSRDVSQLSWLATGLAESGSKLEDSFWETQLCDLVDKLLQAGAEDDLNASLDRLFDSHAAAHDSLVDLIEARAETGKPSIICCKTLIGKGAATKEGSHKTHGSPLGSDEIEATRKALGWNYGPFEVQQDVYDAWNAKEAGAELEQGWTELFFNYSRQFPELAEEFMRRQKGDF